MQFLFPGFLIALAVLAIPILIHLFNFRRFKKVYFSNITLLRNIQQTSNSRRKLQQWLVLAARCLAITCLVLAFAQPYFATKGAVTGETNYTAIYLDNSFSMGATTSSGQMLDEAKEKAVQIINGFGPDDKFIIGANGAYSFNNQWLSREEALGRINEINIAPDFQQLSGVYRKQQQAFNLSGQGKKNMYFIADFQKSASDVTALNDTNIHTYLVPIQTHDISNVYIDTAFWQELYPTPGLTNQLVYTLVNSGNTAIKVQPVLKTGGANKPLSVKTIDAHEVLYDTVPIVITGSGYQTAELLINDDPITFDDNYFIAWNLPETANVLIINDEMPNRFLTAALESSGLFNITNEQVSQVNYSRFDEYQLIVVNGLTTVSSGLSLELKKMLDNGTNVVFFPAASPGNAMNQLSTGFGLGINGTLTKGTKLVSDINIGDPIFKNVFEGKAKQLKLPVSQASYAIHTRQARGATSLLDYRDGSSFLARYPQGSGYLFVCAAPLDLAASDLLKNGEIIVPFLFKAAFEASADLPLSLIIGRNSTFDVLTGDVRQDAILQFSGPQPFIPEQISRGKKTIINTGRETILPGIYQLEDKSGKNFGSYAFNYDRRESNMEFYTTEQLIEMAAVKTSVITPESQANLAAVVQEGDTGRQLWKTFLILALVFLLLETALLRFVK